MGNLDSRPLWIPLLLIYACKIEGHCEKHKDSSTEFEKPTDITNRKFIFIPCVTSYFCTKRERDFAKIEWIVLENDFSFRPVLTITVFSENLHTGDCTASNTLYGQWGNSLFQVRPDAGKEVSSGLSLFALPWCTPHPGVSPLVLEFWVPVPRTFACLWCVRWQSPGKNNWLYLKRINWKQQYVKS